MPHTSFKGLICVFPFNLFSYIRALFFQDMIGLVLPPEPIWSSLKALLDGGRGWCGEVRLVGVEWLSLCFVLVCVFVLPDVLCCIPVSASGFCLVGGFFLLAWLQQ